MKNRIISIALIGLLNLFAAVAANALTNTDIIKMVGAGLSDEVIISTIRSSSANTFDTSADGLIALKQAKVSEAVISTIVKGGAAKNAPLAKADAADQIGPDEILFKDKDAEVALSYRLAEVRSQARGLGFGGVAVYNVLRGAAAERRLTSKTPTFIVAVPKNAQVESYITLALFAVRKNGNREVMVGGGAVMGVSSLEMGVTKDRVVAVSTEKLADQSRAKDGFVLFSLTPKAALAVGEYAFVVTPSQTANNAMGMGQAGSPCYDFGIN